MIQSKNVILKIVEEAIASKEPLSVKFIRELRDRNKKAVFGYKAVFWIGIAVFNLALWVPLPITINGTLLNLIAFVSLAIAVIVPIIGLKKHQMNLELLKVNKNSLKKKTLGPQALAYWDKLKQQDRPLINAEFTLLEGSKWPDKPGPNQKNNL
jgi:hypothetical protein